MLALEETARLSQSIWAVTKRRRLGGLKNNRNVVFTVWEAGKLKLKVPADSGCSFLVHRWLSSLCVLTWQKKEGSSGVSYKGTSPIHEGTALDLITSEGPHFNMNFGGTHIQSIVLSSKVAIPFCFPVSS